MNASSDIVGVKRDKDVCLFFPTFVSQVISKQNEFHRAVECTDQIITLLLFCVMSYLIISSFTALFVVTNVQRAHLHTDHIPPE